MMRVGTSIEMIRDIKMPTALRPEDFNGDVLEIGNHVLFAQGRGRLADGRVIGLTGSHATMESLNTMGRLITVEAEGCIKVSEETTSKDVAVAPSSRA